MSFGYTVTLYNFFSVDFQAGVRLTQQARIDDAVSEHALPLVGAIAAGKPIEALETIT